MELRVSSHILSIASPVFKAMFNERFAEGHGLSPASPRRISLPDDDANTMEILCYILHHDVSALPDVISWQKLADLSVLCDKYDCIRPVQPSMRLWIRNCIDEQSGAMSAQILENMAKCLFAAYVLDLPTEFKRVTKWLLRESTGNMPIVAATHGYDFLPLEIIGKYPSRAHYSCLYQRSDLSI
jgi:hypothetical protein